MERISTSPENQSLETTMLSQFSCPTCTNYVLGPVIQCRRGHFFCSECFQSTCSLCGTTAVLNRSTTLEKIRSMLNFPCRYADRGCSFLAKCKEVKYHEYLCPYSQTWCPLKHIGCSWKGRESEVLYHCNYHHPQNTFRTMSQDFHLQNFNVLKEKKVCLLFNAHKYLFRLTWELDAKTDTFLVAMYFLGTPPLHLMFDYQISFSSRPNPGYYDSCVKLGGPIHKLEDDRFIFMVNKFTKLSFEQLCSICDKDGHLYYTVDIFCSSYFD